MGRESNFGFDVFEECEQSREKCCSRIKGIYIKAGSYFLSRADLQYNHDDTHPPYQRMFKANAYKCTFVDV